MRGLKRGRDHSAPGSLPHLWDGCVEPSVNTSQAKSRPSPPVLRRLRDQTPVQNARVPCAHEVLSFLAWASYRAHVSLWLEAGSLQGSQAGSHPSPMGPTKERPVRVSGGTQIGDPAPDASETNVPEPGVGPARQGRRPDLCGDGVRTTVGQGSLRKSSLEGCETSVLEILKGPLTPRRAQPDWDFSVSRGAAFRTKRPRAACKQGGEGQLGPHPLPLQEAPSFKPQGHVGSIHPHAHIPRCQHSQRGASRLPQTKLPA